MKFVTPLNEATRERLWTIVRQDASWRRRCRAHAVILSAQGYRLDQLATIFDKNRNTVSTWLKLWEERAFDGLDDKERDGRPRKTTGRQDRQILRTVERHPQQARHAQALLAKKNGIVLSARTIQRRLRENGYTFKRVVKRPARRPDPQEYERAKRRLQEFERQDESGDIDLYYGDAAGFSLAAPQPSAWQHPDRPLWIAAQGHQRRLNVMGFFKKDNRFNCCVFEKSLDSSCVIASIDDLLKNRKSAKPAVIVLDNAPIHHTDEMKKAQKRWKPQNVSLEFLPVYSPELNRIEILWRRVKYHWLPLQAFYGFAQLRRHLYAILNGIGSKYKISFVT